MRVDTPPALVERRVVDDALADGRGVEVVEGGREGGEGRVGGCGAGRRGAGVPVRVRVGVGVVYEAHGFGVGVTLGGWWWMELVCCWCEVRVRNFAGGGKESPQM